MEKTVADDMKQKAVLLDERYQQVLSEIMTECDVPLKTHPELKAAFNALEEVRVACGIVPASVLTPRSHSDI